MRDVIEFAFQKRLQMPVEHKDSFEYRKDRPLKWLQKLCIFALKKIGAYQRGTQEVIKHLTFSPADFMERLFKQCETISQAFDREPDCVLIGANDFKELMRCADVEHYFQFTRSYNKGRSVMGLQIHVIPWMKGVLVLPRGIV